MSTITVYIDNKKNEYVFRSGCTLLDLLRAKGYEISAPCGGNGLCGKCLVLFRTSDGEPVKVSACKTVLNDDCEVYLDSDLSSISWNTAEKRIRFERGRTGCGAAVDLGTTTVAVSLYDLHDGKEIGSLSYWNAQKSFGADVISRIGHCMENPNGLQTLSDAIRGQILSMLKELCSRNGLSLTDIREGFLAGNTVMEHIFAGISPNSIASAPFIPASYFDKKERFVLGGIPFFLSPCIAGYVGGDITAGIFSSEMYRADKRILFIDVGTNGEIVLGSSKGLVSCAVASGPAFEGAGISCGMPAADGAIHSVTLNDNRISFEVIGGGEAKGLCGSGLLDLAACLLEKGILDESGCLENDDGENVYYLTDSVYLTQHDVRQLQLAKAAVAAGIARLLETENIGYKDIDALYLSGGFGTRLKGSSAVRIGMLPSELSGKIRPLGNTSLSGAAAALLNPSDREILNEIQTKCRYLELSSDKVFSDRFIDEMFFPED